MKTKPRVLIIGLDCLDPELAFNRYADRMPTLTALRGGGTWGRLRSTDPPITVPAWSCMMSSQDPGQLGFYGFRNRKSHAYDALGIATALDVKVPRLWNILSNHKEPSIVVGVPQTYPPPKRMNGILVAGFLTPSTKSEYTYPPNIKNEIGQFCSPGDYIIDVENFRTDEKDRLLRDIYAMSRQRFKLVKHLMEAHPFRLAVFVEMGPDRLHHGFWRYCSPTHRLFTADNPYVDAIGAYYQFIDQEIKALLKALNKEDIVLLVSDHGAQDMVGGFCINQWLIEKGLLTLRQAVDKPSRLTPQMVDWSRTKAWGEGGYYGRIFINLEGREPQGQVPQAEYVSFLTTLRQELEDTRDPEGELLGTTTFRPQEIYREVRNIPPDLIVYFGNLRWRSVGTVGAGGIHTFSNDTGPDDANHAPDGIFVMSNVKADLQGARGEIFDLSIYDVAPTVLRLLDLPPVEKMIGKIIQ